MGNPVKILVLTVMLLPGFAGQSSALTLDAELYMDVKVVSAYVWRGEVFNDEAVIQPSVTFVASDWSLNVWGTWDLTDTTNSSARTRMDILLDYAFHRGVHVLKPGIIAYVYHDATYGPKDDTFEVFLEYAIDVPGLPSLTLNYDFGEIEGFYASLATRYEYELVKDRMDMSLRADVGAADKDYANAKFSFPKDASSNGDPEEFDFRPDQASLIDFTVSAGFPVRLGKHWSITPSVKYMTLLDSDIKDASRDAGYDTEETAFALTLSAGF